MFPLVRRTHAQTDGQVENTMTPAAHRMGGGGITERNYLRVIRSEYGWLGSRVVSVLDSGAEGTGFKSQPRRCRVTVLDKLLTPIVPLFTKQRNW